MEKMRLESINMTEKNIDKIGALFPNIITEAKDENGNPKKAINFALLKQLLSDEVVDGDEAYEFTWVGKKASMIEVGKPIRKTLRPYKEESKKWEDTENLYIEGDNLDVMKLLQESYLESIKMIYIDPPYNTGKDFIYRDDFSVSAAEYDELSGIYDDNDNKLFQNNGSNGRYHSDWCSMMYPRLQLACNLLSKSGVIFINIDDNELMNLRKICDEVFNAKNFLGCIVWKKKTNGNNVGTIPPVHDYILAYAKDSSKVCEIGFELSDKEKAANYSNPDNDPRGPWDTMDLSANHKGPYFSITNPANGESFFPPEGRYWVFNEEEVLKRIKDGRIIFGKSGTARPVQKVFLKDKKLARRKAESWWDSHGMNEDATSELSSLFGVPKLFSHPKPTQLLKNLCSIVLQDGDIAMDFFSGSGTTADAIMQFSAEKNIKIKHIMVQLPENLEESLKKADANAKASLELAIDFLKRMEKPLYLTELGKERIRRAGEKIKTNGGVVTQDLDVGFRVLKLDSTNMKDVYYSANEYSQGMLAGLESNIKEDRTELDLLFGCLLEWGLPLSSPHTSEEIDGVSIHTINDGDLIACFAKNISEVVVKEIAKRQPLRVVFRDSSFANSPAKINVEEIFKLMAPNTSVKVL